eukprot:scaffold12262_cov121-Isochrysis_galbana.AAC.14
MFATVHAAGSSLLGLFSSCTTFDSRHTLTLSKRASGVSTVDRTRYGRATSSPHSFMQHHLQRLSRAAVMGDAAAICHLQEDRSP